MQQQQQQYRRSGKKERQNETQFITKIDGKTSVGPSYFVLYKLGDLILESLTPSVNAPLSR